MNLLPDIVIGRDKLSIQEPFTLNDSLVVRIDRVISFDAYEKIKIKNKDGYTFQIRSDELKYYFEREMHFFIGRYGSYVHVPGRQHSSLMCWDQYSFNEYIDEISIQCDNILDIRYTSYYSNYFRELEDEVRRQGRHIGIERTRYEYLLDNPFYRYGYSVSDANTVITNFMNAARDWGSSNTNKYKYIHSFDYKPEYIKHYMSNEDKDTTLLLGAEIEVAGNDKEPDRDEVVKKCIQIINDSEDDTENLIYSTSDSTVQIELDTMPCSLEFHKNKMNYKEMFKYLDSIGYKGHDCDKAGLHIHACRSYLGKSELVQQLTISKILYIIEKFNDEICVIARRNNDYCKFVGKEEVNQSLDKLYGKYKDNGKKVALNLKHKDTIEFRMFRSTLKYETFILTLEFVKDIIDFAKSVNIEQIELIKWTDLMDTFSDELKEYYNGRLEKEKKNNEAKKENVVATGYVSNANANNTIISPNLMREQIVCTDFNTMNNLAFDSLCRSSLLVYDDRNIIRCSSTKIKTTEEELKDKIKSLKKQIKNSNNFMEKKNLKKELNETQKKLKKEKRNKKSNSNTETNAISD